MAALSPERAHLRAQKAAYGKHDYPSDHPKVVEADRDLAALKLEDYIGKVLAAAPPLNDEQRTRIAALLRVGGGA